MLAPSDIRHHLQSPQCVVKNSEHANEHIGSQAYNGLFVIDADGTVHDKSKMTVRLPCKRVTPPVAHGPHYYDEYGYVNHRQRQQFECTLQYGSYSRVPPNLTLRWHDPPVDGRMLDIDCIDRTRRPCSLSSVSTSNVTHVSDD